MTGEQLPTAADPAEDLPAATGGVETSDHRDPDGVDASAPEEPTVPSEEVAGMGDRGPRTCPSCGEPAHADDRFCEACGADLTASGSQASDTAEAHVRPELECDCGGTFIDGYCDTCGDRQPDGREDLLIDLGGLGAAASHVGNKHHRNEDAVVLGPLPSGGCAAVVCDGVSTTVDAHIASQHAAEAALAQLASDPDDLHAAHRAADEAASSVQAAMHPELGPPSATFLAATVRGSRVRVGGLGDCRAYWLPDSGGAVLVTEDHSWASEQVTTGRMTHEQAASDPRAHSITRWLGPDSDPSWRADVTTFDAAGPGLLLLCSDGLWNYVTRPEHLSELAGPERRPAFVADRLVRFALDAGGHDNITVAALAVPSATPRTSPPRRPAEEEA